MSQDNQYDKYKKLKTEDQESEGGETGETGAGGKSGQVEFRDFLGTGEPKRDDLLSAGELKRLLSVHKEIHEGKVKKQKNLREQRRDMKNGKVSLQNFRQGLGSGMNSQYLPNPYLLDKAQFASSQDPQVNSLPDQNIADTNEADRNKLENEYQLRYAPEFTPAMRYNPPKLTR